MKKQTVHLLLITGLLAFDSAQLIASTPPSQQKPILDYAPRKPKFWTLKRATKCAAAVAVASTSYWAFGPTFGRWGAQVDALGLNMGPGTQWIFEESGLNQTYRDLETGYKFENEMDAIHLFDQLKRSAKSDGRSAIVVRQAEAFKRPWPWSLALLHQRLSNIQARSSDAKALQNLNQALLEGPLAVETFIHKDQEGDSSHRYVVVPLKYAHLVDPDGSFEGIDRPMIPYFYLLADVGRGVRALKNQGDWFRALPHLEKLAPMQSQMSDNELLAVVSLLFLSSYDRSDPTVYPNDPNAYRFSGSYQSLSNDFETLILNSSWKDRAWASSAEGRAHFKGLVERLLVLLSKENHSEKSEAKIFIDKLKQTVDELSEK